MKYYIQLTMDSEHCFQVVWGEPLKEDDSLAIVKVNKDWRLLDIASGLYVVEHLKTKKAVIEWYQDSINNLDLQIRLTSARITDRYKLHCKAMCSHKVLNVGDKCTYIDVKDSVILDLIQYLPKSDTWIVEDEWHQFEISPDRLIKVSEVQ